MVDLDLVASGENATPLVVILDDTFHAHVLFIPLDQGIFHMFVLPVPALVHVHIQNFATPRYNIDRDFVCT